MNEIKESPQASRRTAHVTVFLACMVVIVALFATNPDVAAYAFAALAFLAIPPAARHAVGDLAQGGGLRGAWRVLATDAKPGAPEPRP